MPSEDHGVGKISPELFARVIQSRLGRSRPEVRVGPRSGMDVGVVDVGGGQVLVATTDPLFVVPAYGWERAAWFALHIIASDAATSGLSPRFASIDLNLPRTMPDADLAAFWEAFHQACERAGIAIVTGHTGRYDGCAYPILGAGTLFCLGPAAELVTPAMARVGDQIIVTKGPAIETTGQLGVLFAARLEAACGEATARAAEAMFWQMSVVEDARLAVAVGVHDQGVSAMHDATEFGLWGALVELADAAGTGIVIDQDRIVVPETVARVCAHFAIDPFSTSSEGTLVIACRPHAAKSIVNRLEQNGIRAMVAGELVPLERGRHIFSGGRSLPLNYPENDPFWVALERAIAESGGAVSLTRLPSA